MSKLTTHVLDTADGVPASGVRLRLYRGGDEREILTTAHTNDDGRCDGPLIDGSDGGTFELEFDVGEYFRARGQALAEPPFLDTVVLRFSMQAGAHYHVPLLVSPWSYSTYRGS